MSNAVGFLLFAVLVSVIGGTVIALRHRRPTSFTTSIDDFSERMSALAPDREHPSGAADRGAADEAR